MPIHDWTRVTAGTFHDFHTSWLPEMRRVLNAGLLPDGYYAQVEQAAGAIVPDVLTLQGEGGELVAGADPRSGGGDGQGGIAVVTAPPRVALSDSIEMTEAALLAARQRHLAIRRATGDRPVALVEVLSPGNKVKAGAMREFVDKAVFALERGLHLLVIDLFPPGPGDPRGVHGAIWGRLGGSFEPPAHNPLTLAGYVAVHGAAGAVTYYVEPTAVGEPLIDMPLFLDPGHYVNVPLEATYLAAYEGVPQRWKRVIEGRT